VAALLRLQARRMDSPSAREALEEAVRRVGSIAIVHETLSQTLDEKVDFDEIADRVLAMVAEISPGRVTARRVGRFGILSAATATPLSMVLTELLQNALEHGFGPGESGTVEVGIGRSAERVSVFVDDDGRGLPAGFDAQQAGNLGLQIVRTLVVGELGGSFDMLAAPSGRGTRVAIELPRNS
jgi:two-component sensor histidine kinase